MRASRRFRRRVRRRQFAGAPPELSLNGRVLSPAEREDGMALAELVADEAADEGCTCIEPEVLLLEGTAGSIFTAGKLTQVAVAHESDCPLSDGDLDEAMSRMATLDRIFNRKGTR